jgi:hypothetical protein
MRTVLLYICVIAFSLCELHAQTINFHFVESIPGDIIADTTFDAFGNPELSISVAKSLNCELSDTSGIESIRVFLGSTENGSDILNQTFDFDGELVSENLIMTRLGIICRFDLGSVSGETTYVTLDALSSSGSIIGTYTGLLN